MSRTWTTCSVETRCGNCGGAIKVGHPQQEITVHPSRAVKRRPFVRCRLCADGTPPEDLPAPVVNRGAPIAPTLLLRSGPGTLPLDYKAIAAGDREPGADD